MISLCGCVCIVYAVLHACRAGFYSTHSVMSNIMAVSEVAYELEARLTALAFCRFHWLFPHIAQCLRWRQVNIGYIDRRTFPVCKSVPFGLSTKSIARYVQEKQACPCPKKCTMKALLHPSCYNIYCAFSSSLLLVSSTTLISDFAQEYLSVGQAIICGNALPFASVGDEKTLGFMVDMASPSTPQWPSHEMISRTSCCGHDTRNMVRSDLKVTLYSKNARYASHAGIDDGVNAVFCVVHAGAAIL